MTELEGERVPAGGQDHEVARGFPRLVGLVLGPALFLACLYLPSDSLTDVPSGAWRRSPP